jgi:hypothetical protein
MQVDTIVTVNFHYSVKIIQVEAGWLVSSIFIILSVGVFICTNICRVDVGSGNLDELISNTGLAMKKSQVAKTTSAPKQS